MNPARMSLVTAPAAEPWAFTDPQVSLALRLDGTFDQTYVTSVLKAARLYFERVTGLCLITQTWRATFDALPAGRELVLPRAPLQAADFAVTVLDDAGVSSTYAASNYALGGIGIAGTFGRVRIKTSATWPTLGDVPDALRVEFKAGFGPAKTDVPEDIRLGLLQLSAWWYEQRMPVNVGNIVNELPHSLNAILESHRVANIA